MLIRTEREIIKMRRDKRKLLDAAMELLHMVGFFLQYCKNGHYRMTGHYKAPGVEVKVTYVQFLWLFCSYSSNYVQSVDISGWKYRYE